MDKRLLVLALGMFALGTDTFVVAGVLPQIAHTFHVDIAVAGRAGTKERVMRKMTAVAYDIARGSVGAYYPEANVLIALDQYDKLSGTPSYKSTPVVIRPAAA